MELIQILAATVVTLGILVTIHEYGHYWVAKRCGVKVLRFSIGFGTPLLRWHTKDGTEFCIAAIPLGGYVKMLDEREGEVAVEERELAFNRKPVGQRIAVVIAGPAANFLFAIVAYWLMFVVGVSTVVPIVGETEINSAAANSGMVPGEEIVAIDGQETLSWQEVNIQLLSRIGDSGAVSISTLSDLGQSKDYQIEISRWLSGKEIPDPLAELGIVPFRPDIPARIGKVIAGGAGERGGLQEDDLIVAANDVPIKKWGQLVTFIQAHPQRELILEVERRSSLLVLEVVPEARQLEDGETQGYLGIGTQNVSWPPEMQRTISYSIFSGWIPAAKKTWNMSVLTLQSLKKMLLGLISVKNLSGPITIAKVAGASAEQGAEAFLNFLAYLSISLGLINILPIPVLDGGHLMYYLAEIIRGKPISERFQMMGLRIGMSLIFGLMMLAIYNDIARF